MDPYIGQLALVPYTYAPAGWALCNGQLLPIAANAALFSLLGTYYGGNGVNTFGLPDLRGRVPVGAGAAPGLTPYEMGQMEGNESIVLLAQNVPPHTHAINAFDIGLGAGVGSPANAVPAANYNRGYYGAPTNLNQTLHGATLRPAGAGHPHENRMPYLTLNWIIALQGIYPQRT